MKIRKRFTAILRGQPVRGAFTLVEVVLALGIVAFAMVALIALIAVALDSSHASEQDTLFTAMTWQVASRLRATPFESLAKGAPTLYYYFDNEGHRLDGKTGAIYECRTTLEADADFSNGSEPNLLQVEIEFNLASTGNSSLLRSAHLAIARYE